MELVGIEPATGLPVTAMAVSPWIAPQSPRPSGSCNALNSMAFSFMLYIIKK